jgi:protein SCO1
MNSRMRLFVFIGLVIILLWLLLLWDPRGDDSTMSRTAVPTGGDFTLHTAAGPLSLKDLRGKVVALYFGYTFCPDICPTSLSLLAATLNTLSPQELQQVKAIFVSVDPGRDTLEQLRTYSGFFHAGIIGATGSREEIDAVVKKYGAGYKIFKTDASANYSVDHSSYTYIIDKNGRLRYTLVHGTSPDEVVRRIRSLL